MMTNSLKKKTLKNPCKACYDMHYFNACYFILNINLFVVSEDCKKTFQKNMKKPEFKKKIETFRKIINHQSKFANKTSVLPVEKVFALFVFNIFDSDN